MTQHYAPAARSKFDASLEQAKIVGAKPPLRPSQVWSIRTKQQMEGRKRDLALFNLAIDTKLRDCDVAWPREQRCWSGNSKRHPSVC